MQLTMGQVQERLHTVHQDMAAAQRALMHARDKEVEAAAALRVAVARASLSEECPVPKRGENGVTVAMRGDWIDKATHGEWFAAEVATATRKAAEDALRVSRDQASVVQSLASLMRAELSLSGAVNGA